VPTVSELPDDFRSVFTAEFAFVSRSLQRLGVREADVLDVAQELFLSVHARLHEWDRQRPIRPWLFGFAIRFASNYRKLGRHRGRPLDHDEAPDTPRLGDKLDAKQLVQRALDSLDFDKRLALVMHDLEGFTGAEIATELGIPIFTVYSRVRVARETVREIVTRAQTGGTP
jgi:RNA polymerase sigma-70 factor (ECF subfamily)